MILNIANSQLLHNPSDGVHTANATQVLNITNAVSVLKQSLPSTPPTEGLIGNGLEGSDLPAEKKMAVHTVDKDVEFDPMIQKSQVYFHTYIIALYIYFILKVLDCVSKIISLVFIKGVQFCQEIGQLIPIFHYVKVI